MEDHSGTSTENDAKQDCIYRNHSGKYQSTCFVPLFDISTIFYFLHVLDLGIPHIIVMFFMVISLLNTLKAIECWTSLGRLPTNDQFKYPEMYGMALDSCGRWVVSVA